MKQVEQAKIHLGKDPIFRPLVSNLSLDYLWEPNEREAVYPHLLSAIIAQQISTKAAASIETRFKSNFGDDFPSPEQILQHNLESLRSMGLSRQKANYIQNIATHFQEHQLLDFNWDAASNEEITKQLTAIKGVGQWTVEIILMFALNRADVFPIGDLAIRNAMIRLYGVQSEGKQLKKELTTIAANWQPYRTLACYYLWTWKHREFPDFL